jgi:hypothetical protein
VKQQNSWLLLELYILAPHWFNRITLAPECSYQSARACKMRSAYGYELG